MMSGFVSIGEPGISLFDLTTSQLGFEADGLLAYAVL